MAYESGGAQRLTPTYVDRLAPSSVRALISHGVKRIAVLDEIDTAQRSHIDRLRAAGVDVQQPEFFAGHLKDTRGESIYLVARKIAGELSLEAAKLIIAEQPLIARLNALYGRETLRLALARTFMRDAEAWILRALAAEALARPAMPLVWLEKPPFFEPALLVAYLPGVRLRFYTRARSRLLFVLQEHARDFVSRMKRLLERRTALEVQSPAPSVLMIQEDNVRADRSLRGQPHWLDTNEPAPSFATYIRLSPLFAIAQDAQRLQSIKVRLVSRAPLSMLWKARKKVPALAALHRARRALLRATFRESGLAATAALFRCAKLLLEGERLGAVSVWLNARVFLFREAHLPETLALQLVAADLSLTTIAYQYSNMGFTTPGMLTTADYFVGFSKMFRGVFHSDGIGPRHWVVGGYPYDGLSKLVRSKARQHRDDLRGKGAQFVLCYLDESVQHDRWGLVSQDDHLAELHVLTQAVLDDPKFGVIVKPQFLRNSPSGLYPGDTLIREAKATGRYVELIVAGKLRNDVYPAEAALAADICVGHKFGATAALESAIAGARCVLLNQHGLKTPWDNIYRKAQIEFDSIEVLMTAIQSFRAGNNNALGDWRAILDNFDPFHDGKATHRLRQLIERSIDRNPQDEGDAVQSNSNASMSKGACARAPSRRLDREKCMTQ
jgi:hypothetical protein